MQSIKNAAQIIKHTNMASAARRQSIGGGGDAPVITNLRQRPQIDGDGATRAAQDSRLNK